MCISLTQGMLCGVGRTGLRSLSCACSSSVGTLMLSISLSLCMLGWYLQEMRIWAHRLLINELCLLFRSGHFDAEHLSGHPDMMLGQVGEQLQRTPCQRLGHSLVGPAQQAKLGKHIALLAGSALAAALTGALQVEGTCQDKTYNTVSAWGTSLLHLTCWAQLGIHVAPLTSSALTAMPGQRSAKHVDAVLSMA